MKREEFSRRPIHSRVSILLMACMLFPAASGTAADGLDTVVEGEVTAGRNDLISVLAIAEDACGLQFVLDGGANIEVTFSLRDPSVRDILNAALTGSGLDYLELGENLIRIGDVRAIQAARAEGNEREDSPLSDALRAKAPGRFCVVDVELLSILTFLKDAAGMEYILGEGANPRVTFSLQDPSAKDILDLVLPGYGLEYRYLGGNRIQIVTAGSFHTSRLDRLNRQSGAGPVPEFLSRVVEGDMIANQTRLSQILKIFHDTKGLQFVLDSGCNREITITLRSPSVYTFLRIVLPRYGLDYMVLSDGMIRIGTKYTIQNAKAKLAVEPPPSNRTAVSTGNLRDPLDKRLAGGFIADESGLEDVLTAIENASGLSFHYDGYGDVKVTFQMHSPTVREVLDFLLPSYGLQYTVLDGGAVRVESIGAPDERLKRVTSIFHCNYLYGYTVRCILEALRTDGGRIVGVRDGKVIVSDTAEAVARMKDVFTRLDTREYWKMEAAVFTAGQVPRDRLMSAIDGVKSATGHVFIDPRNGRVIYVDVKEVVKGLEKTLANPEPVESIPEAKPTPTPLPIAPSYKVKLVFGESAIITSYTQQDHIVRVGDVVRDPLGDFKVLQIDAETECVLVELTRSPGLQRWIKSHMPATKR